VTRSYRFVDGPISNHLETAENTLLMTKQPLSWSHYCCSPKSCWWNPVSKVGQWILFAEKQKSLCFESYFFMSGVSCIARLLTMHNRVDLFFPRNVTMPLEHPINHIQTYLNSLAAPWHHSSTPHRSHRSGLGEFNCSGGKSSNTEMSLCSFWYGKSDYNFFSQAQHQVWAERHCHC